MGFPLEGFDAVGRTRTVYQDGVPVDLTGELADKSTIVGADGLLQYLQKKEAQVMKTLAKKMIGYALGRTVQASDRALVDSLVTLGGNASFADLATKVVTSRQFRNREGDQIAAPAPKSARTAGMGSDPVLQGSDPIPANRASVSPIVRQPQSTAGVR